MTHDHSDITEALLAAGSDDAASKDRVVDAVMPSVYEELRALAHRALSDEEGVPTLSTTVLIHEAYLRLADSERVTERGRAYFFAAASRAMRRIIVDYARRRDRLKRGGGARPVTLDTGLVGEDGESVDLIDLDRALTRLAEDSERAARVVECRFFGGLSVEETALALDMTPRTVKRDWAFARAWLYRAMAPDADPPGAGTGGEVDDEGPAPDRGEEG